MKKALIIIGSIIALVLLVSAFLPSKVRVERSIMIEAPVEVIFDQVNDLTKNFNWSPWLSMDPNMELTYGEQTKGAGASYSWSGNNDVGTGTITILESVENQSIVNNLDFGEMGVSKGFWTFSQIFRENDEGEVFEAEIQVTWAIESELSWPVWRFFGLFMDGAVGPNFEKGLAKLKEVTEALPVVPKIEVTEVDFEGVTFVSITDSIAIDQIGSVMGEMYGTLSAFLEEKKVDLIGHPICLYNKWNMEEGFAVIEAALPVSSSIQIKGNDNIKVNSIPACKAAKVVHVGPYEELNMAHFAIDTWIAENGKQMVGPPWEVYVTDPQNETDNSKYITEVYYPIQ